MGYVTGISWLPMEGYAYVTEEKEINAVTVRIFYDKDGQNLTIFGKDSYDRDISRILKPASTEIQTVITKKALSGKYCSSSTSWPDYCEVYDSKIEELQNFLKNYRWQFAFVDTEASRCDSRITDRLTFTVLPTE